jgi:hypothetical protein
LNKCLQKRQTSLKDCGTPSMVDFTRLSHLVGYPFFGPPEMGVP